MEIRDRVETAFEAWGHTVYRSRWVAIAVMGVATVALAAGIASLRFEMSTEAGPSTGVLLPPILQDDELASVMQSLLAVAGRYQSDDFPIYITGNPEMSYATMVSSRADMARFAGLTNLIIALLLLLLFRRISGVVLPLLVVTLPLAATLGIMGFSGLPLTTAGALGSFAFADLTPIAGLGIAAPTGVVLALVYSVVLLTALLAVLPIRPRRSKKTEAGRAPVDRVLAGIGDFSTSRPWLVVACWSVLVAAAIFGAARLQLAHRPLEWLPEDHPTRVAAEVANREMKGLMPLERELIAQELLLFENSGSDDLEELVDTRFQKARITLLVT